MMLPLLSPSVHEDNFTYVDCNDTIFTHYEDEGYFRVSSPSRDTFPDIEPFRQLLDVIDDKVKLLTSNVDHLREEIGEKNETINKLLDFINRVVHPKGIDDTNTDGYNDSVSEFNDEVTKHNLSKQLRNNITTRKKKKESGVDDGASTEQGQQPPTSLAQSTPLNIAHLEAEITFLKNEITNKNNMINFLMNSRAGDHRHRLILDDELDGDDEDDDEQDQHATVPSTPENEVSMLDSTLEVMERLFMEDVISIDSTQQSMNEEIDLDECEDFFTESIDLEMEKHGNPDETNEPEEEPQEEQTYKGGEIMKRIDTIEKMLLDLNKTSGAPEEMLSVAPWDRHSNGFASQYMKKNGHQPGQGLGKSGNGITQPIPSEKKTFDTTTDSTTWPKGTILIAGASLLQGLDETKMSRTRKIKVRPHGGATIDDMRDHLNALLRKKPDHVIIHAHSNDASDRNTTADDMFDKLMDLKSFAESKVPNIKVTFSSPIIRTDNTTANNKQVQLKNRLLRSGLKLIENDNIDKEDLGRKGLHLKPSGSSKLAKNIISFLKEV